jgi:predicted SAM-dependent methyltransferase
LDVGCGINKYPGAIGLDRNPNTRADVLADLDRVPFPFRDGSFREIRATHVIEHVSSVIATMEEFHRLLAPGGHAIIVTPHLRTTARSAIQRTDGTSTAFP